METNQQGLYTSTTYSYLMVGIQLTARVGEKGQVVIPKPIRDQFNIGEETEVVFDVEDSNIVVKKKQEDLDILEEFFADGLESARKKGVKWSKTVKWKEEYSGRYAKKWSI